MVLQKILVHDGDEEVNRLYLRGTGRIQVKDGKLRLPRKQKIDRKSVV